MKHKRITALALGMLLILSSGCSLVDKDEEKAAEIDRNKIIIEYKDLKVKKDDINKKMNKYLTAQGMAITDLADSEDDKEIWDRFKNDVVQEVAADQIALEKAAELGLDKLTEEEETKLNEAYESSLSAIQSTIEYSVKANMANDESLDYDTEYNRQMEEYFYLQGYSVATYREDLKKELIIDKVKEYYTKDIVATEADVRKYYDDNVGIQKNNMEISPEMVEQQASFGGYVLYYPAGYMKIRHLLVGFESETRGEAAIAYANGDMTEYNRIIDEALPTIQPEIDAVLAKLEAGEDFTALIDEYNDDTSVAVEPYRSEGFVEGPYSTNIDIPGYIEALTKLTEPGQYTTINTFSGCYIIRCEKLLEGAVPYEDVKDSFKASLETQKKDLEWSTVTQGWIDEAKDAGVLKFYTDRY